MNKGAKEYRRRIRDTGLRTMCPPISSAFSITRNDFVPLLQKLDGHAQAGKASAHDQHVQHFSGQADGVGKLSRCLFQCRQESDY